MQNPVSPQRRWKKISSQKIFTCSYLTLHRDQVLNLLGKKTYYYYAKTQPFVAIIPVDHDGGIYFVRQHRYTIRKFTWELPMGSKRRGESYLAAAKRELKEEATLTAQSWKCLGWNYVTATLLPNRFYIFLATNLKSLPNNPDPEEIDAVHKFSIPQIKTMIKRQEIISAAVLASLFQYYLHAKV